jgi:hypothetical protein
MEYRIYLVARGRDGSVARGLGVDMKAGKLKSNRRTARVHAIVVAGESIDIPGGQRARLMGASALAGGTLRGLAVAAGMVTVFGGAPAFAGCQSSATDLGAVRLAPPRLRPASKPPRSD